MAEKWKIYKHGKNTIREKKCIHYIGITYYKDEMMEVVEEGITLTRALAHLEIKEPCYSVDWFTYCPRCGRKLEKRDE